MKKNLLLLLFILAGIVPKAFATRQTGADLSYTNLAPGVYEVTLRLFRDCSTAAAANSYTLTTKSQGCIAGRTLTMNRVGQPLRGLPYCTQVPVTCDSLGRPNFEEYLYSTVVTFDATENACSDWTLGVTLDGNRTTTANINGTSPMYIEAYLKLNSTINNSSPKFNKLNVAIPFVCVGQDISYAFNAADPDGDSLTYNLVAPLSGANNPVTYNISNGGPGGIILNPNDNTQFAIFPPGSVNYSPNYPLPSYSVNWSGPNPHYAVKSFDLNPLTGLLKFKPGMYKAGTPPSAGENKYSVAVEVSEWRKLTAGSNVRTKIGAISREIVFIVEDCGANRVPSSFGVVANTVVLKKDTLEIINLRPGTPLKLNIASADDNAVDNLKMETDVADRLNGAVLISSNIIISGYGSRPYATINWTPTAADVRDQPYYFNVIVNDDECPLLGYRSETFGVRVSNTHIFARIINNPILLE